MGADAPFRWLGHSTVLLPGPPVVVIDPWRWREGEALADVVLVTHDHIDHCSLEDVHAAAKPDANVFTPDAFADDDWDDEDIDHSITLSELGPSGEIEFAIKTLPAEGPVRDGKPCGFHVRGEGLSYLVTIGVHSYLHLGDSRALDEHEGLAPDVAFIPAGGMTVMTPEEAADAAERIGARLSVPIHWGDLNGRHDLARRFIDLCAERGLRAALEPEAND